MLKQAGLKRLTPRHVGLPSFDFEHECKPCHWSNDVVPDILEIECLRQVVCVNSGDSCVRYILFLTAEDKQRRLRT